MSDDVKMNFSGGDGAGADATSKHTLEAMAVGGFFGAIGLFQLVTVLPNTLKAYFKFGQLPYAANYLLLLMSASLPGIVLEIATNSKTDGFAKFFMLATIGLMSLLMVRVFGWLGNMMIRQGFTWAPGAGALRRRLGIDFSLREKLEKIGVGAWFSRLIAPSAPVQAVTASDLPALVGEGEEWMDGMDGQKKVHSVVLGNFIRQLYSPEVLATVPTLGGIPVPVESENTGIVLTGKPGSGKTQAYYRYIIAALNKAQPSILADAAGVFYSRFGRPGRDFLLNPLDQRSVAWSPFAEIRQPQDCLRIARAAIPAGEGEDGQWAENGQKLFADCMLALWKKGIYSTHKLLYMVQSATVEQLKELIGDGSPSSSLLHEGQERLMGSVRFSAAKALGAWRYLPDEGTFSIRDWVQKAVNDPTNCGWLYVTHRADQVELRGLVSAAFDLAMVEMLTVSENNKRRVHFFLDEADSLGGLGQLKEFASLGRKHGACLYLGVQVLSQMQQNFGEKTANTIFGCLGSRMVLAQPNADASEYWSKTFGKEWIRRWNASMGNNTSNGLTGGNMNFGKNSGLNEAVSERPVVSAGKISDLENMHGFIKFDGYPVAPITLEYQNIPQINEAYIPADLESPAEKGGE